MEFGMAVAWVGILDFCVCMYVVCGGCDLIMADFVYDSAIMQMSGGLFPFAIRVVRKKRMNLILPKKGVKST